MLRKLICIVGVLVCLVGLTACGPEDTSSAEGSTVVETTAPTPTPTPVPTPTPNPWEGASFAPDGTVMSHSSITHTAEVVEKEGLLPYVLYTPSTAATMEKCL